MSGKAALTISQEPQIGKKKVKSNFIITEVGFSNLVISSRSCPCHTTVGMHLGRYVVYHFLIGVGSLRTPAVFAEQTAATSGTIGAEKIQGHHSLGRKHGNSTCPGYC